MNIGIVTTWFERGAAYVSKAYMAALSAQHNVFIYARGGEKSGIGDPNWDLPNVTWQEPVEYRIVTYIKWKQFKKWVIQNNLQIVIFNEQHSWIAVLRTREELPVIVGGYVDYYTPETVPFFQLYDFLLCNTKRHLGVFRDHPGALFISWGTDINLFQPNNHQCQSGLVTFFHSSGLSPSRKGTDILLRAFEHVQGDTRLIVHSQGTLEDSRCGALIEQDSRVTLIEKEVGAPGLYHLGDVYVYPTRLEGIGLTIHEALSSGLPVVITDAPPMNEFITDGTCGKLVEVEFTRKRGDNYYWPESCCSTERLTDAMQFFVDNKGLLPEFKRRAREHAEQHLDWAQNARELGRLLESFRPKRDDLSEQIRRAIWEREKEYDPRRGVIGNVKYLLRKAGAHHVKRWLFDK